MILKPSPASCRRGGDAKAAPQIEIIWCAWCADRVGEKFDAIVLPAIAVRMPGFRPGHWPDFPSDPTTSV